MDNEMENGVVIDEVEALFADQYNDLIGAVSARLIEIARINAAPKTRSVGKAHYEAVNPDSAEAAAIAEKINAGAYTRTGIDFEVGHGVVRKVAAEKGEKIVSVLGEIDTRIKEILKSMQQVALSQKPTARVRGASSGGSHAITKEWFDKHSQECPAGMEVAWDNQTNKITYNLPKGGRGGTVSHGALTNVVKAFGGKSNEVSHDEPTHEPEKPVKKVPAKKSKKN